MDTYLEQRKPILAVKSEIYFSFQIRRMKEVQNAQTHFSQYRPSNYGTITAVLVHMLRQIPHSPVAKTSYLSDALRDLHFYKVMGKFGTFFLHELDLENASLPGIEQEDSNECLLAMSRVKSLRLIKEKRAVDTALLANEEPTEQFPIGNAPSWDEITSTMARNPTLLMSEWAWDDKWATRSTAGRLFVQFTTDYFLTLATDVVRNLKLPKPKDLKGAMELWTLRSLTRTFNDVSFKPSNHGLLGNVAGRRNPSFKDMVHLFFPIPEFNIRKDSVWHPFLTKGYIREFHETLYPMTDKDTSSLLHALGKIFGRIQCLPNAVACTQKACGRLWEQFNGGVRMLTNPVFYKIEKVGKAKRLTTVRRKQVKAGRAIIEARLDEEHRHIPFNEGRLKARQVKKSHARETERRSGKKNNYRKPPTKRKKTPVPLAEESSSEEVHNSSDENVADIPSVRVIQRRRAIISEEEQEEEEEEEEETEDLDELDDDDDDDDGMDEVGEDLDYMEVDEEEDDMAF
jgi:hypothetical protein